MIKLLRDLTREWLKERPMSILKIVGTETELRLDCNTLPRADSVATTACTGRYDIAEELRIPKILVPYCFL